MATAARSPQRLHHTAYVSSNLENTRKFYEDLIGLPLMRHVVRVSRPYRSG